MANPLYPASRRVWQDTELESGQFAFNDNGQASASGIAAATIPFGRFVTRNSSGQITALSSSTIRVDGISGISQQVKNYENRQYTQGETVEVMRRGFAVVDIDPANKPTAFGTLKISYASGKQGMLTSSSSNSYGMGISQGMSIVAVGDTTAVVYLPGKAFYAFGGGGYKFIAGVGVNASSSAANITVTGASVGDIILAGFGTETDGSSALSVLRPGVDIERIVSTANRISQLTTDRTAFTYIFMLEPTV